MNIDTRLQAVPWRDLTNLRRIEIVRELLLSLPWLAVSFHPAARHLYPVALLASFFHREPRTATRQPRAGCRDPRPIPD